MDSHWGLNRPVPKNLEFEESTIIEIRHLFWRHYLGALAPYTDGNVRIALRNSDCRDLWADFALGFVSWWQDWSRWRKKTLMLIYNLDGESLHGELTWAWDSTPHTNGSLRGEFNGPHSRFPRSIESLMWDFKHIPRINRREERNKEACTLMGPVSKGTFNIPALKSWRRVITILRHFSTDMPS